MKPSWSDAPEWANWLAMDEDGRWYWFEHQPEYASDGVWRDYEDGRYETAIKLVDAEDTLEERRAVT